MEKETKTTIQIIAAFIVAIIILGNMPYSSQNGASIMPISPSTTLTPTSKSISEQVTEGIKSLSSPNTQLLEPIAAYENKFLNKPISLDFAISGTKTEMQLIVTDGGNIIGRYIATYDNTNNIITIRKGVNDNLDKIPLTILDISKLSGYAEDGRITWLEQIKITSMFSKVYVQ